MRRVVESWLPTLNNLLSFGVRLIGAVGLVYEIFVDHLRNPTAIVVFGGLAGAEWVILQALSARERIGREEEARRRDRDRELGP